MTGEQAYPQDGYESFSALSAIAQNLSHIVERESAAAGCALLRIGSNRSSKQLRHRPLATLCLREPSGDENGMIPAEAGLCNSAYWQKDALARGQSNRGSHYASR